MHGLDVARLAEANCHGVCSAALRLELMVDFKTVGLGRQAAGQIAAILLPMPCGADAIVGLWDVDNMVCTHTITRCSKFTRSVSFSYDSQLIASSSEEDGVDLAMADTGELVGKVVLGRRGGADEICFHPKANLLACARCPSGMGGAPAAVTVAKIGLTSQWL